jgi:uncharacterized repeat protein (TIGR01451 family)
MSGGLPVTNYSFTFSDFLLDETSYDQPCAVGDLVTQTYDDANLPHDGLPYEVSAACQVAGHEASRDVTVCDAVRHCTTATVIPAPLPLLYLQKTATPTTVQPGDPITYTLAFANEGSTRFTVVSVTDTVPVSVTVTGVFSSGVAITQTAPGYVWAVQDLPPGAGGVITITGYVNRASAGTTFTNRATIAAAEGDVTQDEAAVSVQNYTFFTLTTAAAGDGSVTAGGVYTQGTEVVITATANTGSYFAGWTGDAGGVSNPLMVTMDSDRSITATFDLLTYTVNIDTDGNGSGSITADPDQASYAYGTVVTLTAAADTVSTFTGWAGDCSGTDTCALTMTADRKVTAIFTTHKIYAPFITKP